MSNSLSKLLQIFDLTGQTAVVTGGAGLLGAQFCRTLARAGAHVVIVDKNGPSAYKLAQEISDDGLLAIQVETDITNPASIADMVSTALKWSSRFDILVNSAAIDPKFGPQNQMLTNSQKLPANNGEFETFPLEAWNTALEVNLTGAFLCCQAAAGPMLNQGKGVIINIASMYGIVGPDQRLYQRPDQPAQYKPVYYTVTKAGILGLTRYLATYYAGKNIRVNALTPGGIFNGHDEVFLQEYSARSVLGRMANIDEMNGALLFLASEASSYMTGANLVVDGGWTAW